jgi:hypothetical protein
MSHDHHTSGEIPSGTHPARGILLFMTVLGLLLVAVIAGLWLNGRGTPTEIEDAARADQRLKNLAELQAADSNALTTYGWNDKAKGIVHIPVTKAMELVLPTFGSPAPAKEVQP